MNHKFLTYIGLIVMIVAFASCKSTEKSSVKDDIIAAAPASSSQLSPEVKAAATRFFEE